MLNRILVFINYGKQKILYYKNIIQYYILNYMNRIINNNILRWKYKTKIMFKIK